MLTTVTTQVILMSTLETNINTQNKPSKLKLFKETVTTA